MSSINWLEVTQLGIDEILMVLPHRYPFLMVDRVLEIKTPQPLTLAMSEQETQALRVGTYARTIKNVTYNEFHFQGHFPGNPIFPGVLTLEAMAQSAAFITLPFIVHAHKGELPRLQVVLAGFDNIRFRKMVRPGDQLEMRVTCTQARGPMWGFDGEVLVDGKRAAGGSFLAQLTARASS